MLYQKDIPEAIACVVSPKDNTSSIYRITNEGMNHLQKCQNKGAIFHEHPKDVIFFEEVDVDYYDGETTIMDFRTNNSESNITNDMEMEDSLPDIDHPRRYRDSFERIDFTKIAEKFRAGVIPKGRPRKDKNATHSFKTTKPSSSDKIKSNDTNKKRPRPTTNGDEPPKKRGRHPGSKNKAKSSASSNLSKELPPNIPCPYKTCETTAWVCFFMQNCYMRLL